VAKRAQDMLVDKLAAIFMATFREIPVKLLNFQATIFPATLTDSTRTGPSWVASQLLHDDQPYIGIFVVGVDSDKANEGPVAS
jgi:hypothetical protein